MWQCACLLCDATFEDEHHLFGPAGCPTLCEPCDTILPQIKEAAMSCYPVINIIDDPLTFVQFACDPSSPSLIHNNKVNLINARQSSGSLDITSFVSIVSGLEK